MRMIHKADRPVRVDAEVAAAAVASEVRAAVASAADPIDRGPLLEDPEGHVEHEVSVDALYELALD